MQITHLKPREVAARLRISPSSLERWRALRSGPCYIKVGNRVFYPIAQLEAWEVKHTVACVNDR